MNEQRRRFLQLTAAGLIHVGSQKIAGAGPAEGVVSGASGTDDLGLLIRKAAERGHTDLGWLKSHHSFSFGGYYDQAHVGFRSLRVINDDRIAAGRGFPTHPHRDMEILSYVLDGALQHRDSTGQGSIVRPGDLQMMSAGTGITHSEYNPSRGEANHFLQVWIRPAQRRLQPKYQQQRVEAADLAEGFQPIATPDGVAGPVNSAVTSPATKPLAINQDAHVLAGKLRPGARATHTIERNRHGWLQVATGELTVNGTRLLAGDAIATSRPTELQIETNSGAEALLFDLG